MKLLAIRTFLVWLTVWPLVTALLISLGWLADDLPLVVKTMILTAVLVPLISLVLAPGVQRWLTRALDQPDEMSHR